MNRYTLPICIAAAAIVLWGVFTIIEMSRYHALQQLHIVSAKQFEQERPTSGYFQMNDGRLAYEWSTYGGRELSPDGAVYHTYVPYEDMQTKNIVAMIEFSGQSEAPEDLHPLAYTTKGASQVIGLAYPFSEIRPDAIQALASDNKIIPEDTPLIKLNDSAVPPTAPVEWTGIVALLIAAIPFLIVFLTNREPPKPRYRDDTRYKPSWRDK